MTLDEAIVCLSRSSTEVSATKNLTTKRMTKIPLPFEIEVYPVFPDIPLCLSYSFCKRELA